MRSKVRYQLEKMGLHTIASQRIGAAVKIAECLLLDQSLYPCPDDTDAPSPRDAIDDLLASGNESLLELVSSKSNPHEIVQAAIVKNVALDMFHEDRLRDHAIILYEESAALTTNPLNRALEAASGDLNPWQHPYYSVFALTDKLARDFFSPPANYFGDAPADDGDAFEGMEYGAPPVGGPLQKTSATLESVEQFLLLQEAIERKFVSVVVDDRRVRASWYVEIAREFLSFPGYEAVKQFASEKCNGAMDGKKDIEELEGLIVGEWDKLRFGAMKRAFETKLSRWAKRRLFKKLKAEASRCVVRKASQRLFRMCMEAPIAYPLRGDLEEIERVRANAEIHDDQLAKVFDTPDDPEDPRNFRTIALYLTSERDDECCAVVLESDGTIAREEPYVPVQRAHQYDELLANVKSLIEQEVPRVVVVNASTCARTRKFVNDMRRFNHERMRVWATQDREDRGDIDDSAYNVDDMANRCPYFYPALIAEDVANMYAASAAASKEYPGKKTSVLKAISLGRRIQNPLCEIARLWSDVKVAGLKDSRAVRRASDNPILQLDLHPMQSRVNAALLSEGLERALLAATAYAGVDVNDAALKAHLSATLQFVPGLGPRKSLQLAGSILRSGDVLKSREHVKGMISEGVYANACPFLLIRKTYEDDGEIVNVVPAFDRTRIHPKLESQVREMCKVAVGNDLPSEGYEREIDPVILAMNRARKQIASVKAENPTWAEKRTNAICDLIREKKFPYPRMLGYDLDLRGDYFSQNPPTDAPTEAQNMMIEEVRFPFQELRFPYAPPPDAMLFSWMTTSGTLRRGELVKATFRRVMPQDARAPQLIFALPNDSSVQARMNILDSGKFVGDWEAPDFDAERFVENVLGWKPGDDIEVVVLRVKKKFFSVDLSAKEADIAAARRNSLPQLSYDNYFDAHRLSSLVNDMRLKARRKNMPKFISRTVNHPSFKNASREDVEAELNEEGVEVGHVFCRPSSHGTDHVAFTWKYADGEIRHVLAKEMNKKKEDPLGLGSPLLIDGKYEYSDIDDVIVNYITPLTEMAEEMRAHRKFRIQGENAAVKEIEALKGRQPKSIPYLIFAAPGSLWTYTLCFIPGRKTVSRLELKITPDGYMLAGSVVKKTVDGACNTFKKSWRQLWEVANRQNSAPQGYGQRGQYDQRGGYDNGGYQQRGHQQRGYQQGGYQQGGYQQGGYQQGGYGNPLARR